MALNIKPFEGPKAPDWTDPPVPLHAGPAPQGQEEKSSLENSNAQLLLMDPKLQKGAHYKLKKLDIV